VLTATGSRARLNHMIDAVKEITDGKGSNFFLFAEKSRLASRSLKTSSSANIEQCAMGGRSVLRRDNVVSTAFRSEKVSAKRAQFAFMISPNSPKFV
jgi:hypothetical protein